MDPTWIVNEMAQHIPAPFFPELCLHGIEVNLWVDDVSLHGFTGMQVQKPGPFSTTLETSTQNAQNAQKSHIEIHH